MEFDTFIAQAWDDHVRDPQGVADRLADCKPLVADEQPFILSGQVRAASALRKIGDLVAARAAARDCASLQAPTAARHCSAPRLRTSST